MSNVSSPTEKVNSSSGPAFGFQSASSSSPATGFGEAFSFDSSPAASCPASSRPAFGTEGFGASSSSSSSSFSNPGTGFGGSAFNSSTLFGCEHPAPSSSPAFGFESTACNNGAFGRFAPAFGTPWINLVSAAGGRSNSPATDFGSAAPSNCPVTVFRNATCNNGPAGMFSGGLFGSSVPAFGEAAYSSSPQFGFGSAAPSSSPATGFGSTTFSNGPTGMFSGAAFGNPAPAFGSAAYSSSPQFSFGNAASNSSPATGFGCATCNSGPAGMFSGVPFSYSAAGFGTPQGSFGSATHPTYGLRSAFGCSPAPSFEAAAVSSSAPAFGTPSCTFGSAAAANSNHPASVFGSAAYSSRPQFGFGSAAPSSSPASGFGSGFNGPSGGTAFSSSTPAFGTPGGPSFGTSWVQDQILQGETEREAKALQKQAQRHAQGSPEEMRWHYYETWLGVQPPASVPASGASPSQPASTPAFGASRSQPTSSLGFGFSPSQAGSAPAFGAGPSQPANAPASGAGPSEPANAPACEANPSQPASAQASPSEPASSPASGASPFQSANTPASGASPSQPASTFAFGAGPSQPTSPPAFGASPSHSASTPASGGSPSQPASSPACGASSSEPASAPAFGASPSQPASASACGANPSQPASAQASPSEPASSPPCGANPSQPASAQASPSEPASTPACGASPSQPASGPASGAGPSWPASTPAFGAGPSQSTSAPAFVARPSGPTSSPTPNPNPPGPATASASKSSPPGTSQAPASKSTSRSARNYKASSSAGPTGTPSNAKHGQHPLQAKPLANMFMQPLPHAAPRLSSLATAGSYMRKCEEHMAQECLQTIDPVQWLRTEPQAAQAPQGVAIVDTAKMEAALQQAVFGSTEHEDWHADLKWMQQTFIWPPGLKTQCGAETDLSKYCILLQPHHITNYCQQLILQSDQGISQLDVARQQRLLTAVSRVSMHQRMQIVFMGFRGRFAEVGVCTQGDIAFLEMSDVDSLNLPKLAQDTVTTYVQQKLCRPPLLLDLGIVMAIPNMITKVLLDKFQLGCCLPLFAEEQLHTIQDLLMVPSIQVNSWEERFAVKLPFRKLSLLITSLRCNVWWQHLKANNWLPGDCSVSHLVLYDIDSIWHHISSVSHLYCANPLPSVSAFNKLAKMAIGDVTEEQKLHHIWSQYQDILGRGFGFQAADDLLRLHDGDFDELCTQCWGSSNAFPPAVIECCRKICNSRPVSGWSVGPTVAEVKEQQTSGLGSLMDWLSHKDVQLAAYFPFFKEAGIDEIEDLGDLSIHAVQGYMLPWDVRRLVAALSNFLSPEQSSYGCFEPSLFYTARFNQPLTDDAKWLQTEFFARYATELAQPGIRLIVPADTLFLTPPMLDKVNWASQHSCGPAWQKAVTAALTPEKMSLQTHYAALKQRFPQMLAAAGVKQADNLKWLEQDMLTGVLRLLPRHVMSWLSSFVHDKPVQAWEPFHPNLTQTAAAQLQAWETHAAVKLPLCLGVRSVTDLEHVDARLCLSLVRPVELAKLRWALRGYQAQLRREKQGEAAAQRAAAAAQAEHRKQAVQDQRAAAKPNVQKAYRQCKAGHDVHTFVQQLCSHCPALDVEKLGDKPVTDTDSPAWKSSMRIIIGNAIKMVHPDKAAVRTSIGTTPLQEAHALEMYDVLLLWRKLYA